jgi:predicted ATPase/class 3 adenylate cyclase
VRDDLPTGTVTFLFTDVEGSTRLLHELGDQAYAAALAEHCRLIRDACAGESGVEVDTQGDAFFVAFPTAPGALAAASAFTENLASGPISVRVGLHTGTPLLTDEGYVGPDVHRAARIAAAGHGGQVLVSATTATLVSADGFRDLGEHRLKDLAAAERIYQLGDGEFPALKSLYRTNLPVPATPFLGREDELTEVLSLLASEDTRLVTLTGPGGTGKTRLALQAAAEAAEAFPDGVWWVPLAPLRDPTLVLESAAQAVGSHNGLAEHISDKAMLCLFDNFEQVVEAGAALAELVAACPKLEVLVTSRERLRVVGEQTYPVPPLAESDGEALFLTRARAVDPAFAPSDAVRELCLRLDELPLALELAAARTAVFSPEQLLEKVSARLDLLKGERDADPRQQTLRATIEWSYDLLSVEEQRLFGRLAVFAGGCTYEAAEQIAGADPDTLQSLLDKSLLRKRDSKSGPRYWMLETIREYAMERLEESSEAEGLRRRHAQYFLDLAEEAEPYLRDDGEEWLARLETEHDNMRTALDFVEASHDGQLDLRLTGALSRLWYLHSHLTEGRQRLEAALASDTRPTAARAKALSGASVMALQLGDSEAARRRAEEALELHRELGDPWGSAYSTMMLGNVISEAGDLAAARPFLEESMLAFGELGDEHYTGVATANVAWVVGDLGEKELERALLEENLERARALNNRRLESYSIDQLAMFARDEGRLQEASEMLRETLRINRELGDRLELAINLGRLANVLGLAGDAHRAARLLASSEALTEHVGAKTPWWARERNEKTVTVIREQLTEAVFDEAWEDGSKLSLDQAVALALDGEADEDDGADFHQHPDVWDR